MCSEVPKDMLILDESGLLRGIGMRQSAAKCVTIVDGRGALHYSFYCEPGSEIVINVHSLLLVTLSLVGLDHALKAARQILTWERK